MTGPARELRAAEWTRDETAEPMRGMHEYRRSRLAVRAGETDDGTATSTARASTGRWSAG